MVNMFEMTAGLEASRSNTKLWQRKRFHGGKPKTQAAEEEIEKNL